MTSEQKALRLAAGAVMIFGLAIALGAHPASGGLTHLLADLILWPMDGAETGAAHEARLLYAIAGGVMAGWGWALWLLAGEGIARAPDLSRRVIRDSVVVWFAVDCAGSLAAGAPLNLAGNLIFLLLFLVPLHRAQRAAAGVAG